ncbi:MAG: hypothetical protein JXR70_16415 [Spirochaetales bacterium]|nr:hypothetical protein [Spirochaetales bacterium]
MSNEQIKSNLLKLRDDVEEFQIIQSGKESKRVDGLYQPSSREIILHNKNHETDNELMYTAIHEFAHHIQFTEAKVPISAKSHSADFFSLFHQLLIQAERIGIYENEFAKFPDFLELTEKIKREFMKQNGERMKEFGKMLLEAKELCAKYNLSFTDYLDRIISMPRNSAAAMIKSFKLDLNPDVGFENMRQLVSIPNKEQRKQAEADLLAGKSPAMVTMEYKRKPKPPDPVELLTREKQRIEKTIDSLTRRLQDIEQRLNRFGED